MNTSRTEKKTTTVSSLSSSLPLPFSLSLILTCSFVHFFPSYFHFCGTFHHHYAMKNAQEKCFVEENDDFQLEKIAPCSSYMLEYIWAKIENIYNTNITSNVRAHGVRIVCILFFFFDFS